jgi:hypothetical protein
MNNGLAEVLSDVVGKEFWVAYNESYKDTPPYIKELIFDKVELLDDAK